MLAATLCLVTVAGLPPADEAAPGNRHAAAPARDARVQSGRFDWMFDPNPALEAEARRGWQGAPLEATLQVASAPARVTSDAVTLAALAPVPHEAVRTVRPSPAPEAAQVARIVPLPMPRPSELLAKTLDARVAERRVPRRTRTAALPAATGEAPSFFEELFGARKEPAPALAYAALENGAIGGARGRLIPQPDPAATAGTAIYDISARIVRLPSGEVLEAHSGLGAGQDNPDSAHLRMRGVTPPGTYDLTEREQLFHGVRALRLNPVGGSAVIHGRDGLLAHTYMLGPGGASNGCVSFRDYNRFLQAYLRGEVRRLIVVAGRWQDGPAHSFGGLFGRSVARRSDG
ncbi:tlde1 domain-containing protein [uncultured Methylobacterium sp.]|uniref:DUF2778 domain-containing protein n=1 Tax=uncultured Methylobacterium sp. TaxID=157278 RepID=UPI0035CB1A11